MSEKQSIVNRVCSTSGEPVHHWCELSYANYLVLPRTLLQSMPQEWQQRFVACLEELDAAYRHLEHAPRYDVRARGDGGRYLADPIPHYNRGRTHVAPHLNGAQP